eukprot:1149909-Pelagomonas_calceolata.AAC.2
MAHKVRQPPRHSQLQLRFIDSQHPSHLPSQPPRQSQAAPVSYAGSPPAIDAKRQQDLGLLMGC